MTATCPNIFVYGTLRRGSQIDLARMLAQEACFRGTAKIQGRLYAVNEYPGMVLSSSPGDWVKGDVYTLREPEKMLSLLDEYEGCGANDAPPFEFERVQKTAILDTNVSIQCWVYLYRRPVAEEKRIWSGEFLTAR